MKNLSKSRLLFCLGMLGFGLYASAQDSDFHSSSERTNYVKPFTGTKNFRTFSIGINGGVLMPISATGGSNDFTKWMPTIGYGAYVKAQITHTFGLQLEFLKGTLKGNNDNRLGDGSITGSPYESFKTDLNWAASISGTATLANINWLNSESKILPYVTLGAGLADYNPTVVTANTKTEIDYKPSGSINEFFIPVGVGVKANISNGINLDLGYRMNFTDGDNLDGYPTGPQKDRFSYGMIGLEFALGDKNKPQLAFNNPAAALKMDLQDENNSLRNSVAAANAANEEIIRKDAATINALQKELDNMKKDTDGDGVADGFDKCPGTNTADKVDGAGCPLPKPKAEVVNQPIIITDEDKKIVNEAINDLQFDLGKATIRSASYPSLDRVAEILVKKNFSLKLAGHTDDIGSESANLKLSKDRAESVKAYLVSKGANTSRIEATGYGETQPIASNKTAEGRQKNRRVEFSLF